MTETVTAWTPNPAYVHHHTLLVGRRCWLSAGRGIGGTGVHVCHHFANVRIRGRYVEIGWA